MANLTEVSQWESVIRQLENGEAATGGADGLANVQAKQLANRTKWLKENYLPLSGGAMSGNITKNVDNSTLLLCGGTGYKKGGAISISGSGITDAGKVWIEACDGTNSSNLNALPNGKLTWNGTDLAGAAIVAKSLGDTGYVKYASGLIIQWGRYHFPTNSVVTKGTLEVILPIAFPNKILNVVANHTTDSITNQAIVSVIQSVNVGFSNNNKFTLSFEITPKSTPNTIIYGGGTYIAIGI